jgi:hypothetical protein
MQGSFILQILSSVDDGLTVSQIENICRFIGIEQRYKSSHVFESSITQILRDLHKRDFVYRSKTDCGLRYAISEKGLIFLQNEVDLELTKIVVSRCS